jgi:hypothetical protein
MSNSGLIIVYLILHIPLALLLSQYSGLATIHALVTLLLGLFWALTDKRIERVAYIGAYAVGAEVLWRMTGADVFWEFSKYAIIAVFMIAVLQLGKRQKIDRLPAPFFYILFLLPSLVYTFYSLPFEVARQQMAFSLSGPLALAASLLFFANAKLTTAQLQQLLLTIAGPTLSVATLAIWGVIRADELLLTNSSSDLLSGGFGPNQVSSILSLTVLALFFYLLDARHTFSLRLIAFSIMGVSAIVSVMTLSRGGVYTAVASLLLAAIFLLREGSLARRRLIIMTSLLILIAVGAGPYLDNLTGGVLYERYQNVETTGRDLIIQGEIQAWLENPLVGTGPGLADGYRLAFFRTPRTHTEFTRMLAEHGIMGLVSILLLVVMAWHSFYLAKGSRAKAFVVAMISWTFLYMAINAMRLAAPSFAFGLAAAGWLWHLEPDDKAENHAVQSPEKLRKTSVHLRRRLALQRQQGFEARQPTDLEASE